MSSSSVVRSRSPRSSSPGLHKRLDRRQLAPSQARYRVLFMDLLDEARILDGSDPATRRGRMQ